MSEIEDTRNFGEVQWESVGAAQATAVMTENQLRKAFGEPCRFAGCRTKNNSPARDYCIWHHAITAELARRYDGSRNKII